MRAQMFNHNTWIDECNPEILELYFNDLLIDAGFEILNFTCHFFEPQGYTALFLLGESHLAIHTFPEHNQTYIELTSCVKKPFDNFLTLLYYVE